MESMRAAINAGADAVYMGGSRFGARAYADNPEEDRFLEAIDYAHLHGCKLYMTVNTLVKENEMNDLFGFLNPYYERGLDAAIVQDLGVFAFLRKKFPDLPIHASTQMTVTGYRGAKLLKEMGAVRVVPARELSLDEIARIRDQVDIEIESFVHGALCYCYSGQCLLSSLIGGRSGNRGRCAQPCRLPYEVAGVHRSGKRGDEERYLLSPKDLCTLDILPDIIEAGVCSLKIEGRMKSPRYTAGVVSVYRKYVDRYCENGRDGYRVDPADRRMLLDLFDRGGFTEGYYRQHNGKDMLALKEKPAFRETNQALFDRLDKTYVNEKKQEPVIGKVIVHEGEAMRLELRLYSENFLKNQSQNLKSQICSVLVEGAVVQTAQNQPLTEDKLRRQMMKTGNSSFYFEELQIDLAGRCFLPVQAVNEIRRQAVEALEQEILRPYRRENSICSCKTGGAVIVSGDVPEMRLHVSLEETSGLKTVMSHPEVDAVYLDSTGFGAETWEKAVKDCHQAGKKCALILPHIFRREAEQYFGNHMDELKAAGFDELILRSMEEVEFLKEIDWQIPWAADAGLYTMNHLAACQMMTLGAARLTLPLELNSRELEQLGCQGKELMGYGHLPVMVSAQCIRRTTKGCSRQPEVIRMKDRTGKILLVKNHCRFCYNTIYNPSPLSLLGQETLVKRLEPSVMRLSFTVEEPEQIRAVIDVYADHFRYGKETPAPFRDFTRGHMKRGVE